jgi:hypothetical protein
MRRASAVPKLVALLIAGLAVAACSSAAVPLASAAAVLPTASPVATAAPTPSAPPSPAPSATVAIVKISPILGAPDSKLVLQLVAEGGKWDKYTLGAPAGKVWHIEVVSQEPIGHHNFVVASGKTFPERIYTGKNLLPMATVTYDVPGLPAGLFICTVHPETMTGTLTLK